MRPSTKGSRFQFMPGNAAKRRARAFRRARNIALGVAALVALAVGTLVWYTWFARIPKVVYAVDFPHVNRDSREIIGPTPFYELIAPDRLLSVKGNQVALLDAAKGEPVWSYTMPAEGSTEADPGDDIFGLFESDHVIVTTNDLWLVAGNRVVRLDRLTGARKEVALPEDIREIIPSDDAILVVSGKTREREQLTQISLPEGTLRTEDAVAIPAASVAAKPTAWPAAN